ncbi:PLP-dependent aminotransferase family protein [Nocardioides gansuensis]|uniref:PLP-dependent aminotransferase family protein n=1 Tax=Nocardioides gansuensis TaxID=2138300 RepID=A0A2T8F705_9ACTN|nr:PLP-dependent aminotransferase family protein [Nocardioides gansuensis]PVG81485.1 PLP-dependent aminotransferase family protein [Nocardioides gansuensis]
MATNISARRVASLVGDFDTSPAYAGLADALRLLIGDGRIGLDVRLPSERELTEAIGVSRTTVTRAYALLRESGYAEARQGSGTFTRVPGGRRRAHDRAFYPGSAGEDAIDLNCAAPSAPPGLAAAYAAAAEEIPAHLGGHGYFPYGLPVLREAIAATFEARGLPTHPDQVMVTAGALAGASIVAQAFTGPGDRVVVESPTYPNATAAIRHAGARVVPAPVDPDGWDIDALSAVVRQAAPRLAYLIPDFQNPTGHLMSDTQREQLAGTLRGSRTLAVVDEAHQALALDPVDMPRPFASYSPDAITIGSASKCFWGGLRLGWLRAPLEQMERLLTARTGLDLGAPVLEQLVLTHLLTDTQGIREAHLVRLRDQRDALVGAVRAELPEWRFRVPAGGLVLWCELPAALGTALTAEAERQGVVLAPGPVFAVEGGLDRFVRLPWTRPADELVEAVRRLAAAWAEVRETTKARGPGRPGRPGLVA